MLEAVHAYTITFVQTFEFFLLIYIYIYICTIIIYSHSKFYNNWLKTYCHQSWLTSFMHAQSHLCKHLIFLLIYIFAQSLYTHIPNFITIGWNNYVISHDWHLSCMQQTSGTGHRRRPVHGIVRACVIGSIFICHTDGWIGSATNLLH